MKRLAVSILLTPQLESNEVLLVKRNARLAFFGGYFAFPGGTLEEQDREVVVSHLPHFEESLKQDYPLFLAAAARELFEETGVWLARGSSAPSGERLREYRRQMLSGQIRFSQILKREDQHLDGSDFTPICRITTPPFTPERYDTWFLRCQMPVGEEVEIWPGELDEGYFITAEEVLERWRRGEVLVVPPVLILLQELAGRDCQSFLPRVRQLTQSYDRVKLHQVYFSCGVLLAPLKTRTWLPATHTNAYLVGDAQLYLIDPGTSEPSEQEKLWELLDELVAQGKTIEGILLTHHHPDHVGAVIESQRRYGLPVYAHRLTASRLSGIDWAGCLQHGQELHLGVSADGQYGWKLRVYHLPGHAPGHLAFQETRYQALVVGDLVSTLSSILIDPWDGHLGTYMKSLRFLESVAEGHLFPGHGPPMREARKAIQKAIRHRQEREEQVLAALHRDPQALEKLLEKVYSDVEYQFIPLAERSLISGLIKLVEEGLVEKTAKGYRLRG